MKPIKAWAVALSTDKDFIPDFSVDGVFDNVLQIHSDKKSATNLAKAMENDWIVIPVLITPIK